MVYSHLQLIRGNYCVTLSLSNRFTVLGICNHILSRNVQYKGINTKTLRSADTLIKVTALTLTYAGMHFMNEINFTMCTTNYNKYLISNFWIHCNWMNLYKLNNLRMGSATIFLDFNCDSVHIQTTENYSLNLPSCETEIQLSGLCGISIFFNFFNKGISYFPTVPHV